MEKRKSVTQKVIERFERVRAYLVARPALFAAQGSVVATSRTYRGRQLGPYFQVAWREAGRQRRLYLGRSLELVDRVRKLLDQLQQPLRQRRLFARLKRQTRSALRRWMADLRPLLAGWGIELKGFEFRGVRRALRRYAPTFPPHELARPPIRCRRVPRAIVDVGRSRCQASPKQDSPSGPAKSTRTSNVAPPPDPFPGHSQPGPGAGRWAGGCGTGARRASADRDRPC